MVYIDIDSLDSGDGLGTMERPACCGDPMDQTEDRFDCGCCGAYVEVDDDMNVVYVSA